MSALRRYVFGPMVSIPGYMRPLDAFVFAAVLEAQTSRGWGGDVCEIGTYFGRSYFLMRHLLAPSEKLLSIDIYEDTGDRDTSCRYSAIRVTAERLGFDVDPQLMMCADSRKLEVCDVLARAGPFRFVHIDGGHQRDHVDADAGLALGTAAPHGVMCFDDFYNPVWPEVTSGVHEFIRENSEFAIFAIANMKAYLARREYAATYRAALFNNAHFMSATTIPSQFGDDDLLFIQQKQASRAALVALEKLKLERLAAFVFR